MFKVNLKRIPLPKLNFIYLFSFDLIFSKYFLKKEFYDLNQALK
jgi:hypothetical protein